MTTTDGPWVKLDSRTWRLAFEPDDLPARHYDLEYRRAERGCDSGYFLFGPSGSDDFNENHGPLFDGVRMGGPTASLARYEAFYRVMNRVAFPHPFDALVEAGAVTANPRHGEWERRRRGLDQSTNQQDTPTPTPPPR